MPRSASFFYSRLASEVLRAAGHEITGITGHSERLGMRLPGAARLEPWELYKLTRSIDVGEVCMIKSHANPNWFFKKFLSENMRATYIYRDPRDVMVSALELGEKMRKRGEAKRYFRVGPYQSFARFHTLDHTIAWIKYQLFPRWKAWKKLVGPHVLLAQYENLIENPIFEMERFAEFIGIYVNRNDFERIARAYSSDLDGKIKGDQWKIGRGPMKNKGVVGRYRTYFTDEQQKLCNKQLGRCLEEMGYL